MTQPAQQLNLDLGSFHTGTDNARGYSSKTSTTQTSCADS